MADNNNGTNEYNYTATVIHQIYLAASGRDSIKARLWLVKETETISQLVCGKCKWGPTAEDFSTYKRIDYRKYIMHALLLGVRVFSDGEILKRLSPEKQEALKKAVKESQMAPKPIKREAETETETCKRKVLRKEYDTKSNEANLLPCMRNMAECAMAVAQEETWKVVQEEMQKWSNTLGVPYDPANIEGNEPFKKQHKPTQPSQLVTKAEVKPTAAHNPISQPEPATRTEPLTQPEVQKRPRGRPRKHDNKKGQQDASPLGPSFKKITGRNSKQTPRVLHTADGRILWSNEELAEQLGYPNKHVLATKKSTWLKNASEKDQQLLLSWFDETQKQFDSKYKEKIKELLGEYKPKKKAERNLGTNIIPPVKDDTKKDMTYITGITTYLNKLQGMCDAANAEEQKQKQLSEDYSAKAKEYSTKAQTAKTAMEQAAKNAKIYAKRIKELTAIQDNVANAGKNLKSAQTEFDKQQASFNTWLEQNKACFNK